MSVERKFKTQNPGHSYGHQRDVQEKIDQQRINDEKVFIIQENFVWN